MNVPAVCDRVSVDLVRWEGQKGVAFTYTIHLGTQQNEQTRQS